MKLGSRPKMRGCGFIRPRVRAFVLLLLGLCSPLLRAESGSGRHECLFVYWGRILQADPDTLSVKALGYLSAAAPTVTADANGLLWGRVDPNYFAAWSPLEQRIVSAVPLRHKVYDHVLAQNGKAYVSHNALTSEGFSISVVDTAQKTLEREIKGVHGLRTDILASGVFVYLATLGVRQEDYLHLYLYRIDTRDDSLTELHRYTQPGYCWLAAVSARSLFVCYLATSENGPQDMIEVMDLSSLEVVRRIDDRFWGPGRRLVHLFQAPGRALLLCRDDTGTGVLIETDPELTTVRRAFKLDGPAHRILGTEGSLVLYFDSPLGASPQGVTLHFYDTGAGREVNEVDLSQLVEARRE
jgi:hypothetical protein